MTSANTNNTQAPKAVLEFNEVYKDYPDGDTTVHALAPTTCTIHSGEFVAVVGPSGSGKSTLLTIMGGLQKPSGGSVSLDGREYSHMSGKELARLRFDTVGFVLQSSNLVPFLTLEEQLRLRSSYAHQSFDARRATSLMQDLDIEKLRRKYPDELSGGEKQRAAICVALFGRPAVILADEPTASLDTSRAMGVADIFSRASRREGTAVVMVTHDERLLEECDRVLTIQDGHLEESTAERASQHA